MPEVMKSWSCPSSSRMVRPLILAPVSERAPSTTSCNTVSRSRSSVMRRLTWLSLESRSRRDSMSLIASSASFISSPPIGLRKTPYRRCC